MSISKNDTFLEIGQNYLIRTITMIYTGKIKAIKGDEVLLENACWIAETTRWTDCLKACEVDADTAFNECEPYINDVIVYKGTFLDITKISKLPTLQK